MRAVSKEERDKRGCLYCHDYKKRYGLRECKHDKCPYRELDEFETYEDYVNANGGFLDDLFGEE